MKAYLILFELQWLNRDAVGARVRDCEELLCRTERKVP
jgi:hypothetical protein